MIPVDPAASKHNYVPTVQQHPRSPSTHSLLPHFVSQEEDSRRSLYRSLLADAQALHAAQAQVAAQMAGGSFGDAADASPAASTFALPPPAAPSGHHTGSEDGAHRPSAFAPVMARKPSLQLPPPAPVPAPSAAAKAAPLRAPSRSPSSSPQPGGRPSSRPRPPPLPPGRLPPPPATPKLTVSAGAPPRPPPAPVAPVSRKAMSKDPRTRAAVQLQRAVRGHLARRWLAGWTRASDGGDVFWFHADTGTSSWYPPGGDPGLPGYPRPLQHALDSEPAGDERDEAGDSDDDDEEEFRE